MSKMPPGGGVPKENEPPKKTLERTARIKRADAIDRLRDNIRFELNQPGNAIDVINKLILYELQEKLNSPEFTKLFFMSYNSNLNGFNPEFYNQVPEKVILERITPEKNTATLEEVTLDDNIRRKIAYAAFCMEFQARFHEFVIPECIKIINEKLNSLIANYPRFRMSVVNKWKIDENTDFDQYTIETNNPKPTETTSDYDELARSLATVAYDKLVLMLSREKYGLSVAVSPYRRRYWATIIKLAHKKKSVGGTRRRRIRRSRNKKTRKYNVGLY